MKLKGTYHRPTRSEELSDLWFIQVNTPMKNTQPKIHILKVVDRSSVCLEN